MGWVRSNSQNPGMLSRDFSRAGAPGVTRPASRAKPFT